MDSLTPEEKTYPLPARVDVRVEDLLRQKELLHSLVDRYGSPLRLMLPQTFEENIHAFRGVAERHKLPMTIWYASKANKSRALLESARSNGIGVEVSSTFELTRALAVGFTGPDIGVSGPLKGEKYLTQAIECGCTITVDDLSEIAAICSIAERRCVAEKVPVLLRLSGFTVTRQGRNEPCVPCVDRSRFGIPLSQLQTLYVDLASPQVRAMLRVRGFAFHLDNHSVADRVSACELLLGEYRVLRQLGYCPDCLDVGGGFSVQYTSHEHWKAFIDHLGAVEAGRGPEMMFRGKRFGVRSEEGRRVSRGNFYPYDAEAFREDFLDRLVGHHIKTHPGTVAEALVQDRLSLVIEPGKALVDLAGVLLMRVRGTHINALGEPLLVCEGDMTHLFEQLVGSEFAVDPHLLPLGEAAGRGETFRYLVGNSCSEGDILAWRKVWFPRPPQPGDILAFVNTAGYQMDFVEGGLHCAPPPMRLALVCDAGQWRATPEG